MTYEMKILCNPNLEDYMIKSIKENVQPEYVSELSSLYDIVKILKHLSDNSYKCTYLKNVHDTLEFDYIKLLNL